MFHYAFSGSISTVIRILFFSNNGCYINPESEEEASASRSYFGTPQAPV